MAATAKWRDDISGTITTGGSATAYTVTSNSAFDSLAHMSNAMVAFVPHATNTGTCTLNVDVLGAKPLRSAPSVELLAGALVLGVPYVCTYNNSDGAFYLQGVINAGIGWVAAGGTADAITATYSPALTALYDGLVCSFRASAANATTTPTFSPNGLTAHTIVKKGGTALVAGDIAAALAEVIVRYNLASTRWELLNPSKPFTISTTAPTRQTLTSGSGATYTTPVGCTQIRVRMLGGGGGGGANTGGNNNAGTGGTTSFSTLTAVGGTGGGLAGANSGAGGSGGSGGGFRIAGTGGSTGAAMSSSPPGGIGGSSPFGGAGAGNTGAGVAAIANSGSGGGGAGATGGGTSGGGGGAGEYVEAIITNPAATLTYTIGASGSGATGGNLGGAGGSGIVIVDETYF